MRQKIENFRAVSAEFTVPGSRIRVLNGEMTDEDLVRPLRLFVALPIPETVRHGLVRVQHELEPLAPRGAVRWNPPEQFHLTLKFLGDVPAGRVAALKDALQSACTGRTALRLRAQGVGFFPNARSPRVIWAGVQDFNGRLKELQRRIEDAVRPFCREPAGKNFAGHLTLGRFKEFKRREIEPLTARAATMDHRLFGEWTADPVELIRSELSPTGARHTLVERFAVGQ